MKTTSTTNSEIINAKANTNATAANVASTNALSTNVLSSSSATTASTSTAAAKAIKRAYTSPMMRKIDLIVIHCSATRCNTNFTPEALDACHRKRGFNGCGYHFYITKDGLVHAMRPVHLPGAHARGYNANSIGICYEGGLNGDGKAQDTRTILQKSILHSLVGRLKKEFGIKKVVGHRDLSPDLNGDGKITPNEYMKQCPCFDVASEDF